VELASEEAQLFGTEKGAFTGATSAPGIFERASAGAMTKGSEAAGAKLTGGVVFLDEIGDLAPKVQAKRLPVLSGGVFYRIGTEGGPKY
jgi:transcriptional regulator with AAA-type ATPase domain